MRTVSRVIRDARAGKRRPVFWAMNRDNRTVVELTGECFSCWEAVQGCFRVGIGLPDGSRANGIGRSRSYQDFVARVKQSQFTQLFNEHKA